MYKLIVMNKQSKDYKARKKIGQFFTESKLAEKLIEMFELDFNNKIIVEPSCGDGVFIKQIIKKSPLFKNIIGIDIDNTITEIQDELNEAAYEYAVRLGKNIDNANNPLEDIKNNGDVYKKKFIENI